MSRNLVPDANRLAKVCLQFVDTLPKTGKPIHNHEWTVLSCIAKFTHETNLIEVIAIGTGNNICRIKID